MAMSRRVRSSGSLPGSPGLVSVLCPYLYRRERLRVFPDKSTNPQFENVAVGASAAAPLQAAGDPPVC
jgi:hypothetical protein